MNPSFSLYRCPSLSLSLSLYLFLSRIERKEMKYILLMPVGTLFSAFNPSHRVGAVCCRKGARQLGLSVSVRDTGHGAARAQTINPAGTGATRVSLDVAFCLSVPIGLSTCVYLPVCLSFSLSVSWMRCSGLEEISLFRTPSVVFPVTPGRERRW